MVPELVSAERWEDTGRSGGSSSSSRRSETHIDSNTDAPRLLAARVSHLAGTDELGAAQHSDSGIVGAYQ